MKRIVSMLPAATEIVGALGLMERLVGVSHECDYPPAANHLPRVTRCEAHGAGWSSAEVDRWVRENLRAGRPLFTLDEPLLRSLRPDLILTQRLCDVCAVDYGSVAAMAAALPEPPKVVHLEPSSLEDMLSNVRTVADAAGQPERAEPVVAALRERISAVKETIPPDAPRPRCVMLEWIDPPFCSGHWTPELVELAGGRDPLGLMHRDSVRIPWERVIDAAPEVLVLACCGYSVARTLRDVAILCARPGWHELPAVRNRRVYAADGHVYFNRPGPRLVDSLEIVAEILHPELFRGRYPDRGVVRLDDV